MRARIGPPVVAALALGLALVLGGGLAGCGGKSGNSGIATADGKTKSKASSKATSAADRHEQELKFVKCMRDHGVNMDDPGTDGGISIKGGQLDQETMQKAQEACKEYAPDGGNGAKANPADIAKLRKYAKCMREHGFDLPDPDSQGQMLKSPGPGEKPDSTALMGPDNPEWANADKACHSLLPQGTKKQ